MHQPLCIDYPNITAGIRKLSAITYIKWINMIPQCHLKYSYCKTYIMCSQIWTFNLTWQTSKGKDSIDHNKSVEGRNIIWSDYINKSHGIDHEREIKHIATSTNPQPRGWTTPSSSWWPPGWRTWPPEMIPPPAGCQNGSRLVFGGYRALRWCNFWSRLSPKGFGIFWNL